MLAGRGSLQHSLQCCRTVFSTAFSVAGQSSVQPSVLPDSLQYSLQCCRTVFSTAFSVDRTAEKRSVLEGAGEDSPQSDVLEDVCRRPMVLMRQKASVSK